MGDSTHIEAVSEMTTVRKAKTHKTVLRLDKGSQSCKATDQLTLDNIAESQCQIYGLGSL
jgi:hypothetical protein